MKKSIKRNFGFTGIAILLITASSFATIKYFAATNTAYYLDASGSCRQIVATTTTPFDNKGTSQQAEIVDQNNIQRSVWLNSSCTTPAKFVP